jgi:hypothetical protein
MKLLFYIVPMALLSQLIACSEFDSGSEDKINPIQYQTVEWTELMPAEDLNALLNPPDYIADTQEGSLQDQVTSGLTRAMAIGVDDPYQRALQSTSVVETFDGKAIKLAGFVVPLEFNDDGVITEFFFVPFFGACIHVPPPPPNQIVFVSHEEGFELDELYNPIWVSGILSSSLIENELATSAYSMQMDSFELYNEEHQPILD